MKITQAQRVTNKINHEVDFTEQVSCDNVGRYVVSVKNVFTGTLPSHNPMMLSLVTEALASCMGLWADSVGGWKDKATGIYYVDINVNAEYKSDAITLALGLDEIAIYDLLEEKEINVEQYVKETLL